VPNKNSSSKQSERDQQLDAHALAKYTKTQLLTIAEAIGEPVAISSSRTEIVVVILRAAGYKLKKPPPPTPAKAAQITTEQLDHLLYTYLQDELMLLGAVTNAIKDLILIHDLNTPRDSSTGLPTNVPLKVLRERLEHTLEELRYYQGHSNIRPIANIYRIVNPNAKLDL
jgi:hypothetical protein